MTRDSQPSAALRAGQSAAGGEMYGRIREFDWATTPLGPLADWPLSLKTALRLMLSSRYPMFLWWGPALTNLYNDAYIPVLGARHPSGLGRSAPELWSDIWSVVGPQADAVLSEGHATWNEELLLLMERNGFLEETYFTFSYSPAPDDAGGVGGVFCACMEDTPRVLGARRLRTLRLLAERASEARTPADACGVAAETLAANRHDLAFTLLYLIDAGGRRATLAGWTGLAPGTAASPETIDLDDADAPWPFREAARETQPVRVSGIDARFDDLPGGAWPESPREGVVLPLATRGQEVPAGFVVAGLSPRLPFTSEYRGFLDLLAGQIETALANARAYEEERRRAEALAELDRAKTVFFSNVSHEFRTPLTLMLGPVEDLLGSADRLSADARDQLEVIHRNGLRLLRLVNTLLDFARIEAGRARAVFEPTDLAAATVELASNFRSAAERAGLRLVVDCPPLPEPVFVDREMWEKIVLNLLSNALKFTFEGEVAVSLRPVGGMAELRVRDTGTGIPAEEVPRLFERFHRVRDARSRTHEGTGIGLALVHELVRQHGGTVGVESAVDEGTAFIVSVPLGSAHLPAGRVGEHPRLESTALGAEPFVAEALRWLPDDAPEAPARTGGRATVLVADDNADMRQYIVRLLSERYDVEAVPDGERALEVVRASPPDIVLTDIMMPRLSGVELLRALRAQPATRALPVILLSARAGEESRLEGLAVGADDYLVKPFTARELHARVSSSLALASARQEAAATEERYRAIVESQAEMVCRFRPDGTILFVNGAYARARGTTPDALAGVSFWDFVAREDRAAVREMLARLGPDLPEIRIENRFDTSDGPRWTLWTNRGLAFDENGRVTEVQSSGIDITDRRRAEDALREAARRKDEFLAMLAHELRNPLAPLRTGLELMKSPDADANVLGRARDVMERQLGQLVRLVDDLLDVSRISRGRVELRRERAELAEIIANAVETARPLIDEAGHALAVRTPDEPIPLDADPTRLGQVFANLLNNAAKFTDPGGRIDLTVERDGDGVEVRVADNGVGIAPDVLPHVFDLFTQAEGARARGRPGLGIGLTLVRQLVEMHGGRVEARSAGRGAGSTFVVRLPVAEQGAASVDTAAVESRAAGPRRVLVIDDNEDAATSLAMLLEVMGHEAHTAFDGHAGLEVAERLRPHIVLLDLGMPQMDGYDVANRLRRAPWGAGTVLIALTGWGQEEHKRRTRAAGFDRHLTKPVDRAALDEVLRDVIGESSGH